jgi:hypothetical protein
MPRRMLGDVKITAAADEAPVFVGIARTHDVSAYLAGVAHATVKDMDGDASYDVQEGRAPSTPPSQADIWVAKSSGSGTQQVVWQVQNGDWTVVVMNADGSRGVTAEVAAGATLPSLDWLAPTLLAVAAAGLIVAIARGVFGLRSRGGRATGSS